jgi:hypothetical protein
MHAEIQNLVRSFKQLADANAGDADSHDLCSWDHGFHRGMETAYRVVIAHLENARLRDLEREKENK